MTNYTPINNILLLEPVEKETRTEGGIILPESTESKFKYGRVKKLGDGKNPTTGEIIKFSVKVGDIVIYRRGAGLELDSSNILMTENEIACICENF